MKKSFLYSIGSLFCIFMLINGLSLVANAQNTQTRNVSDFTGISVAGPYDVYIKKGNSESLRMEGDAELLDKIKTKVEGNTLKIYTDKDWWDFDWWGDDEDDISIYITYTKVEALTMSGSGMLKATNGLKGNSLTLALTGSGEIITPNIDYGSLKASISGSGEMEISGNANNISIGITGSGEYDITSLASNEVKARISGSGEMETAGSTGLLEVKITGSGTFNGKSLAANQAKISISGSGDAWVNASKSLTVGIAGSGNVHYTGNPENKSISSSGSGKAIAAN